MKKLFYAFLACVVASCATIDRFTSEVTENTNFYYVSENRFLTVFSINESHYFDTSFDYLDFSLAEIDFIFLVAGAHEISNQYDLKGSFMTRANYTDSRSYRYSLIGNLNTSTVNSYAESLANLTEIIDERRETNAPVIFRFADDYSTIYQFDISKVRDVNNASAYNVRVHRAFKEMYVLAYSTALVEVKFNEDFEYLSHNILSHNIQASVATTKLLG